MQGEGADGGCVQGEGALQMEGALQGEGVHLESWLHPFWLQVRGQLPGGKSGGGCEGGDVAGLAFRPEGDEQSIICRCRRSRELG